MYRLGTLLTSWWRSELWADTCYHSFPLRNHPIHHLVISKHPRPPAPWPTSGQPIWRFLRPARTTTSLSLSLPSFRPLDRNKLIIVMLSWEDVLRKWYISRASKCVCCLLPRLDDRGPPTTLQTYDTVLCASLQKPAFHRYLRLHLRILTLKIHYLCHLINNRESFDASHYSSTEFINNV